MLNMRSAENIDKFDRLLQEANPNAEWPMIVRARNRFLERYGDYSVDPCLAFAVATDEELLRLRHAGKKCQEIYANALVSIRACSSKVYEDVEDILALKKTMYEVSGGSRLLLYFTVGDVILQCIERGIRSKEAFDRMMPSRMTHHETWLRDTDDIILHRTWEKVTNELHADVCNPHAFIVRYADEGREVTYVGIDPHKGRRELIDKLVKHGYYVNVSGHILDLPILFINAYPVEKIKEVNEDD